MGPSLGFTVRVLGVPVSVGPAIAIGLVGMGLLSGLTAEFLVAWVILGFVALLLHELGHAVAFRRYGVDSSISFWLFGGVTIPNDQEAASRLSDRQMLVVAVSGPLVGIVIGGMMLALWPALDSADRSVRVLAFLWTFVNLGWAIFNLLPIGSLDGGRALGHLAGAVFGRAGRTIALAVGIVASVIIAAVAVDLRMYSIAFIAVIFGLLNPDAYGQLLDAVRPARASRRLSEGARGLEVWTDGDERKALSEDRSSIYRGDPRWPH